MFSKGICVMTRKTVPRIYFSRLNSFQTDLTQEVSRFPGCIDSRTFVDADENNHLSLLTMSSWITLESWRCWETSYERNELFLKSWPAEEFPVVNHTILRPNPVDVPLL